MKTPMQELLEQLKEQRLSPSPPSDKFLVDGILNHEKQLLENEKEVMESAWQDGMYECDGDGTFEDFYKTFKTK